MTAPTADAPTAGAAPQSAALFDGKDFSDLQGPEGLSPGDMIPLIGGTAVSAGIAHSLKDGNKLHGLATDHNKMVGPSEDAARESLAKRPGYMDEAGEAGRKAGSRQGAQMAKEADAAHPSDAARSGKGAKEVGGKIGEAEGRATGQEEWKKSNLDGDTKAARQANTRGASEAVRDSEGATKKATEEAVEKKGKRGAVRSAGKKAEKSIAKKAGRRGARGLAKKAGEKIAGRVAARAATRIGARMGMMALGAAIPGPGWALAIGVLVSLGLEFIMNGAFRNFVMGILRSGSIDINEPPSPPHTHWLPHADDERADAIDPVDADITELNNDVTNFDPQDQRLWDLDAPGVEAMPQLDGVKTSLKDMGEDLRQFAEKSNKLYAGRNSSFMPTAREKLNPYIAAVGEFGEKAATPLASSIHDAAKVSNDTFQAIRKANADSRQTISESRGDWFGFLGRATVDTSGLHSGQPEVHERTQSLRSSNVPTVRDAGEWKMKARERVDYGSEPDRNTHDDGERVPNLTQTPPSGGGGTYNPGPTTGGGGTDTTGTTRDVDGAVDRIMDALGERDGSGLTAPPVGDMPDMPTMPEPPTGGGLERPDFSDLYDDARDGLDGVLSGIGDGLGTPPADSGLLGDPGGLGTPPADSGLLGDTGGLDVPQGLSEDEAQGLIDDALEDSGDDEDGEGDEDDAAMLDDPDADEEGDDPAPDESGEDDPAADEGGEDDPAAGAPDTDAPDDAPEGAEGDDGPSILSDPDAPQDGGTAPPDGGKDDAPPTVDVGGREVEFESGKAADVAEDMLAGNGTPLRDLAEQAGFEVPGPGEDIGEVVAPAEMRPGDVISSGDGTDYMYVGEDEVVGPDGQTQPITDVTGDFTDPHQGIFRMDGGDDPGDGDVPPEQQVSGGAPGGDAPGGDAPGGDGPGGPDAAGAPGSDGPVDAMRTDDAPVGMGAHQNEPTGADSHTSADAGSEGPVSGGASQPGVDAASGDNDTDGDGKPDDFGDGLTDPAAGSGTPDDFGDGLTGDDMSGDDAAGSDGFASSGTPGQPQAADEADGIGAAGSGEPTVLGGVSGPGAETLDPNDIVPPQ